MARWRGYAIASWSTSRNVSLFTLGYRPRSTPRMARWRWYALYCQLGTVHVTYGVHDNFTWVGRIWWMGQPGVPARTTQEDQQGNE